MLFSLPYNLFNETPTPNVVGVSDSHQKTSFGLSA